MTNGVFCLNHLRRFDPALRATLTAVLQSPIIAPEFQPPDNISIVISDPFLTPFRSAPTLPTPSENNVSGSDRPLQKWDMSDVFRAAARAFAREDSIQRQHRDRVFSPPDPRGPPEFGRETSQSGHRINKIHGQFVAESHHGVGDDLALQLSDESEHSDVLA